jgi:ankyrin repeat protein
MTRYWYFVLTLTIASANAAVAQTARRAAQEVAVTIRADANRVDPDGTTALHHAVRVNDRVRAETLIKAGASVGAANKYGVTALSLAAANGDLAMTELLLNAGADPNTTVVEGESVLMHAARTGDPDVVRLLVKHGAYVNGRDDWKGQTPLMWAAAENNVDAVKMLVALGADINARQRDEETPRQIRYTNCSCPRGGMTALMFAARQGAQETVRALVQAGARVDLTNPDGVSALTMAIISGEYDTAALLIELGANVNLADRTGRAPLFAAVDMNTMEWIFNRPAPIQKGKYSPIDLAKLLIAKGADINAQLSERPLRPNLYFDSGGNRNLTKGSTPFLRAASTSDVEFMRLLLDAGADPTALNDIGTNAILMSAGLNWRVLGSLGSQEQAIEAITLLLDKGLDINATNQNGQTALHAAAMRTEDKESLKLIEFLIDRGVDLWAKDKDGKTALDVARADFGVGQSEGAAMAARDDPNFKVWQYLAKTMGVDPMTKSPDRPQPSDVR